MRKEVFLKKLDLLGISLNALTLENNSENKISKLNTVYHSIKNQEYNKKQDFTLLIDEMFKIQKFVKNNSLYSISKSIITNKSSNHYTMKQYLLKFNYIYFENKKYYLKYKTVFSEKNDKIAIRENAILNLYILSRLNSNQGIYELLKYLKSDKMTIN